MKVNLRSGIKNAFSKITKKRAIIFIIVVIAAVGLFKSNVIQNKFFAAKKTVTQNTTTVRKGNILVGIAGSGPISFTNSKKVYSKISGTVSKLNYKEGDAVKAGDIIYELDSSDAQASIDANKSNLQQSQISAVPTDQDVANLTIKALIAGQITNIAVNKGDILQKNAIVVTIADTSKLKVTMPFKVDDISQIKVGQIATLKLITSGQTVQGTVTNVSNTLSTTNSGGLGGTSTQYGSVEIQVTNPGNILSATSVNADIAASSGTVSNTSPATLDFITKKDVTTLTGGTVQSISVSVNQRVGLGQTLMVMKNDDVTRAKQLSDLKLASTVSQVNNNLKTLDNFKITAPIDGVITKLTYKVGDSAKPGDEVSDISDPTQMQFDVPIDELDIAKIVVGQKTTITMDALTSSATTPVNGEVLKIAVEGTPVSGVTTFPVTIKINDNLDKLKGGMNANGNIIVADKQNVLYVPIEAVTTMGGKSFVWVKAAGTGTTQGAAGNNATGGTTGGARTGAGTGGTRTGTGTGGAGTTGGFNRAAIGGTATTSATNYYQGAVRTAVEVGVNNDTNIEIISGLKEGQVIVLPQTKAASTTSAASTSRSGLGGLTGGGATGGGGGGFTGGGRGN